MTNDDRAAFEAWAKSAVGTVFSPGAHTSDFYFRIWQAALAYRQGEPVAWMSTDGTAVSQFIVDDMDDYERAGYPIPLYTQSSAPTRKTLTEEQIEDCIDEANRNFNGCRQGPRGQQLTTYDDWNHWFARAIEQAITGEKT